MPRWNCFWSLKSASKLQVLGILSLVILMTSCSPKTDQSKKEIWVYTSIYNEVIEKIDPLLKQKFPEVSIKWFQAGSEKVAAKVNAELLAGKTQADLILTSDPFWYEGLKQKGELLAYNGPEGHYVPAEFRDPDNYYTTVRLCTMVLSYNKNQMRPTDAPKTFKELTDEKWKDKVALGSPMESGTNFTTVAMMEEAYGWDYYKKLRQNNTFSAGGNSTVRGKLETGEYLVGALLLENLLKAKESGSPLEIIYPEDGVVLIPSPMAIMKKTEHPEEAKKIFDFFMSKAGQEAMIAGHMHSLHPEVAAPNGAKTLAQLRAKSFPWNHDLIKKVLKESESIKATYSKLMYE